MSPAGLGAGPQGDYLARARALCIRAEAVGARLVAWSGTSLALGWEVDAIADAVRFAAEVCGERAPLDRTWACGLARGELDSLSPDGQGILGWGPALLSASALCEIARPGEVLVDDEVREACASQLSLQGLPASAEGTRGWRLDLARPGRDAESIGGSGLGVKSEPRPAPVLAKIRALSRAPKTLAVVGTLSELRRARALAQGGPPAIRCHASLSLALALSTSGRAEEALLEALDALARAREVDEPRAIGACLALLAKMYAGVGRDDAATALREAAIPPEADAALS